MICPISCKSKARNNTLFFIFFIFSLIEFSGVKAQEFFIHLEDSVHSPVWLNLQTIDSGYAHSGSHYSVADSAEQYGLGIESKFPEKFKDKNTWLKVEGWVKSNKIADKASFVTSLLLDNKQKYWQNFYFSELIEQAETWYFFSDSVKVPASITNDGKFKAYLWNNDFKDTIAIDDLKISFAESKNPSFIPIIPEEKNQKSKGNKDLLFSNDFYKIVHFSNDESIKIYSINDSVLVSDFSYFIHYQQSGKNQSDHQRFIFKSVKSKALGTKITLESNTKTSKVLVELNCKSYLPEINFEVSEKYRKEQFIHHEAIVIRIEQPVNEIYRNSRKSDHSNFQSEYWLDNQGVKFGMNNESIIIYHNPGISSLQLNTEQNKLWINLDYKKDHPFLHFPLRNDTSDLKIDWSASYVKKGQKRKYSFSIYVGPNVNSLPRFMKNPDGYLATYIWTEHADFTNIRTNRATYFGSENIIHADSAIGGFVKYKIPVTKSVFYSNPDLVTNANISNDQFLELEASIKEDDIYFNFLKQLQKNGTEVCLHTPENFTTNKKDLEEALQFMQREFQSKSWIDHGYNNGLQNNREDLVCDGTLKKSDYNSMKLWEEYDVHYFWNPYYEDYFTFEQWKFGEFMGKPYQGFGNFIPDPDYWTHHSRSGDLIHWPTKSVLFMPDDKLWEYNFSEMAMNEFVQNWGVEINHCYPAWVDPAKGFWLYDADSTIVAAPGLNRTLERMSILRNEGKLNVTTIKEFIDYQLAIEQIRYEILPDGRVKITNASNKYLKGLSFATKAKRVLVNDQIPEQKIVGDDIVFWFDLPSNQSKLIRMIN